MARPVRARTLLGRVPGPDDWFGLDFSMNLYRGCQHGCIYCDSRSECYGLGDLADIRYKENALELLEAELGRKRRAGTIGFGSMNDPYMPAELDLELTGRALDTIARHRFRVHILTKSDLVLRDLDRLQRLARFGCAVSFTVTTDDDGLARTVEPGAPPSSARFRAMRELARAGIRTGTMLMPVLPFIEDEPGSVRRVVERTAESGGSYCIAAFGMTLRAGQREHYYARLDELFPGLRRKYERTFGNRYSCACRNARRLERLHRELCARLGLGTRFPRLEADQLGLFPRD